MPAGPFHDQSGNYRMDDATSEETAFRHSHWSNTRATIQGHIGNKYAGKGRYHNFVNCGSNAQVYARNSDGSIAILANYCHDRFCWPCASARSRLIAHNLRTHLNGRFHRFVTLTLRSSDAPISKQIDRLYASFKLLRRDPWWQRITRGGAAFLETTLNDLTLQWHPHLHLIQEGGYLPHSVLSRKWLGVTGDSHVVYVESIPDAETTISYVTKYASKPIDGSVFGNDHKLSELLHSMSGRRMCLTFGDWQRLHLTQRTRIFDPTTFSHVERLDRLIRNAAAGDVWSAQILALVKRNSQWTPRHCSPSSASTTKPGI